MKTTSLKSIFPLLGMAILLFFGAYSASAQQTSGDVAKQGDNLAAAATATNTSVKLIDNKGTIKYLQVANGLTSLTNQTSDTTLTTWQLGGELTSNTYIDVSGNVFALDGIALVNTATSSASTNAASGTSHGTGTGWTILVRDEATGAVQKLKGTDLIQSGSNSANASSTHETANSIVIGTTGILANLNRSKIWVYRNGAKLIYNTDFTVQNDQVTITDVANSWNLYAGDYFEVQWIK